MDYEMVHLDKSTESDIRAFIRDAARSSWVNYEVMLANGVSREVARMVLPVNVFTELRMTVNLLSLMNILHLRNDWSGHPNFEPVNPGHPQLEIQGVANDMGMLMAEHFPATFQAFADNGYII
jgi:thymidylate synthase (FAD)